MGNTSGPAYASIEQPDGLEPPIVHCPICGKASVEIGERGGEFTPCDHLAFVWIGAVGEFGYQSEDFERRMRAVDMEEIESDDLVQESLKLAGYDNELLALEITYGGMSCGPDWYTDVFGFDYGTSRTSAIEG